MIRFKASPDSQLNPGMKDIEDIGDCRWAKHTHCVAITHPQRMSPEIPPITPVPSKSLDPLELSKPPISLDLLYLSISYISRSPISLVPGFNRVSRKAVKRI
jgi:hypothetical protein